MNSGIEKFYTAGNLSLNNKENFWQHKCGSFQWPISRNNVSLCCVAPEFNEIIWPKIDSENVPGGLK